MQAVSIPAAGKVYDVVVIGAGPAGLTAALYAARGMLRTLVVEKAVSGGQIATTETVENYPGFPEGVLGPELAARMEQQARRFGAEFVQAEVESAELEGPVKTLRTADGEIRGRAVIIATGASHKHLGVPGEAEYANRGVSWCATCDGPFFKGEDLVVVGGGDSALEEGLFLTRYAKSVTVVHRRDKLRASRILQDRAFKNEKVRFVWDAVVEEIGGNGEAVTHVKVRNLKTGQRGEIPCGGVFVYIGMRPGSDFLPETLPRTPEGYLIANEKTETPIPGVFAAGDVRVQVTRQAVTAAGDGCVAAIMAERYLANLELGAAQAADAPSPGRRG